MLDHWRFDAFRDKSLDTVSIKGDLVMSGSIFYDKDGSMCRDWERGDRSVEPVVICHLVEAGSIGGSVARLTADWGREPQGIG
jgi:hypothetical protein